MLPTNTEKMKTEKTDNELIAEFMGFIDGGNFWTSRGEPYITEDPPGVFRNPRFYPSELKFDSSWDWLMPVVEKIETTQFIGILYNVEINKSSCEIYYTVRPSASKKPKAIKIRRDDGFGRDSKITMLHKAVVEFVRWYNTQKP